MIEERLLTLLRVRANARGIVPIRGEALTEAASASQEEVEAALNRLERAEFLSILAPFPFLVLKLKMWPGQPSDPVVSHGFAYSYGSPKDNQRSKSYSPSADAALLQEIIQTLGETDPASFEGAVRNFAPQVIRKALERVRRARSLRKNRTALFRYLLTKLS
jgi:hypothetical protein